MFVPPSRSRFCGWVVFVIGLAQPLLGAVSLPLPPQGDSYYLKGWKHDIVEVIPANLGHGALDFVAKSYVITSGTMFIEARGINVNNPDGTFLWQYDTQLRSKWTQDDSGTHEMVTPWDIDGDGIDEVMTMWFDTTTTQPTPYVVVLDGKTGLEKGKLKLPPGGGETGLGYVPGLGNHYCTIAYLDGPNGRPYFCISNGEYEDGAVWAFYWDLERHQIALKWQYNHTSIHQGWMKKNLGTGNHGLQAYDINGDGRDEIIYGGTIVSADGAKVWSLSDLYAIGHVDGVTVGHLNPAVPGLQIYYHTSIGNPVRAMMVRASDGSVIWRHDGGNYPDDIHHGWCCKIRADLPGWQCRAWSKLNVNAAASGMDKVFGADGTDLHLGGEIGGADTFHRPPEWTGDDIYEFDPPMICWAHGVNLPQGWSYAADVGGGSMHGAEEIISVPLDGHGRTVQIRFNLNAKPYPSRWANRHYRQDVTSFGSGYGSLRLTPQVVNDLPAPQPSPSH